MTELSKYIGADVDVPAEISEQVQERSVSCSDSIRESVVPSKVFLQEKDLLTVDHLPVHRLQDMSVIPDKRIMERSQYES